VDRHSAPTTSNRETDTNGCGSKQQLTRQLETLVRRKYFGFLSEEIAMDGKIYATI
jgi:hypothetical protein